jgi:hypothetical protein
VVKYSQKKLPPGAQRRGRGWGVEGRAAAATCDGGEVGRRRACWSLSAARVGGGWGAVVVLLVLLTVKCTAEVLAIGVPYRSVFDTRIIIYFEIRVKFWQN